jgi:hypothetical protein
MFEMERNLLTESGIGFKGLELPELFFLIPLFRFNGLPRKVGTKVGTKKNSFLNNQPGHSLQ